MSPHLIQSTAKFQMEDRLRSAERRRLAADTRTSRQQRVAPPSGPRPRLRSLRAVFS